MKKMVKINAVLISLLILAGGMVNAQGRGRAMDPGQYCANIPGLTEKQKAELTSQAVKHRAEMDALRAVRQGSNNSESWYAAGQKMTEATDKHRFEVLSVLTDEQKQAFTPRAGFGPVGRFGGGGRGMMMAPGRGAGRGAGICPAVVSTGRMGGGRGRR
jgi:hypothetical protein